MRDSVQVAPGGAENTLGTFTRDIHVLEEVIANFLDPLEQRDRSAQMWRRLRNVHVLLHVRAYGECQVSLAMTHMRWVHGQSGHGEHGPHRVWSLVPVIGARTRTRAEVNVRPRPLAHKYNREKENSKKERDHKSADL